MHSPEWQVNWKRPHCAAGTEIEAIVSHFSKHFSLINEKQLGFLNVMLKFVIFQRK